MGTSGKSLSSRDTLQLVSAAGTSGIKPQWQSISRHLAVGQCSWYSGKPQWPAKTPCKEEPASPSAPPSWPSPQVYQREKAPWSRTLTDYLCWDSHITNTTNKASKTLGFWGRNRKVGSMTIKEQAYKALVRPTAGVRKPSLGSVHGEEYQQAGGSSEEG